ncbi:MAG: TolC family protein [Myxococcales bacterium]|nr:TolC family protein [Myxococcales bacterium]
MSRKIFSRFALLGLALLVSSPTFAQSLPSLSKESLWKHAFTHNPTLRQLRAQVAVAKAYRKGLNAFPTNPSLSVQGGVQSLGYGSTPSATLGPWQPDVETSLDWALPVGGRWGRSQKSAKVALDVAKARLAQAETMLQRDLFQAAYLAQQIQREVEIYQALAKFHQQIAKLALQRKEVGSGTRLEQQMTLLESLQAQQQVLQADARRLQTLQQLRQHLGWNSPLFPTLQVPLSPQLTALPPLGDLEKQLHKHPSLRLARLQQTYTQSLLKWAQSQATPDLTVSAVYAYSMGAHIFRGGLSIPLPIFWRNQANVEQLRATILQRRVETERIRLQLLARLHTAYRRYQLAQQVVKAFQGQILPQLQQQLDLIAKGYRSGQIDLLRLLTARQSFMKGQLGYLQALQQATQAHFELAWLRSSSAPLPKKE